MPRQNTQLVAFNRGLISPLGLARVDLKRTALSAETFTNWMPRVLGSMMLRPGLQYLGSSRNDAKARYLPFVFSIGDTALLEITDGNMRVWLDDSPISRVSVSSTVANGTFTSNLTSWTDADEAGGTSDWVTGGYMRLTGNGTAAAIRRQQVTVAAADIGKEHALRVVVQRGPVTFRVGSTAGGDEFFNETTLRTGTHSLAFTPTGDFHVQFSSTLARQVLVDSCIVESSGIVAITSPWTEAALPYVRAENGQSGDVVFVACVGYQQRRIERHTRRSWSVVLYQPEDGPFRTENTGPITLTASGITGNITLTASAALFRTSHVGALWRHTSVGQQVEADISAENTFTSSIRVTGTGDSRSFSVFAVGTWSATVTLQRSVGEEGDWQDVAGESYTTVTSKGYNDGLDNQIVYYRLGVKTGNYTSGTVEAMLSYAFGAITGVVRITAYSSSTSVSAEVLSDLGGTTATDTWAEGAWSDYRGWPSSVAFHEGRLWWAGKNGVWGSVSDAFAVFDPDYEGDAGPISRTIGSGPVDVINWLLPMQRLIAGAEGAEFTAKSTSFDEPLTPTNFQIKASSTQGSANVEAVKADARGVFVQRGGTRVMELAFSPETYDYQATNITALVPEVCRPKVIRMAIQRQPDTRIHCVRSDGIVALVVYDHIESVLCWLLIETDGVIEDVVVLPGEEGEQEDAVYYLVRRTINGSTKRYLERWATEAQCIGGVVNRQADSFLIYSGPAVSAIPGLSHLEGKSVVVWGGGKDLGTYTVSGGTISGLPELVTDAAIGLHYRARFKSAKAGLAMALGATLTQPKSVSHLGLVLSNTHYQGIEYGPDFDNLSSLPLIEAGAETPADTVHETYDQPAFEFEGEWSTDARICLEANAPRPASVLALVAPMEGNDKY